MQNVLLLMKFNLPIFHFINSALDITCKNSFSSPRSQRFPPIFSLTVLYFYLLDYKFMTHLEFIFAYGKKFRFWPMHVICWRGHFSFTELQKLVPKPVVCICVLLFPDSLFCFTDLCVCIALPIPHCWEYCEYRKPSYHITVIPFTLPFPFCFSHLSSSPFMPKF